MERIARKPSETGGSACITAPAAAHNKENKTDAPRVPNERQRQNMDITDIRIRKLFPEGRLRALVSLTVGGDLAVHDIKVIDGP